MNLNYNCRKKIYMEPQVHYYVEVRNHVQQCQIFLKVYYFYDGDWITKTSTMFGQGGRARIYYERSSSNRDFTIYRRVAGTDRLIYNTMILTDDPICYEVTGSTAHTFINEVQC